MSFKFYQNFPVYTNYKGFSDKLSYNCPIINYSVEAKSFSFKRPLIYVYHDFRAEGSSTMEGHRKKDSSQVFSVSKASEYVHLKKAIL